MPEEKKNNPNEGVFRGVMTAYAILVLHVVLIAGIGLLVFFFGGLVRYVGWILLGGLAVLCASGYYFYRKIKKQGRNLREMLRAPLLSGKSVEVSILGGLASLKVGPSHHGALLQNGGVSGYPLLPDATKDDLSELKELALLLKEGLITRVEYEAAKQKLFNKNS